ncbi:MAG: cation:proton antiporter [Candidatus Liptonbacteria bacterium]|nr:cation:proton antiporter [Candidatus Liptonbacteria bacterium]
MDLFTEIALIVVLAAIFGFIAHYLKQPTIIGYLFAGVVAASFISEDLTHIFRAFSDIGIALLLFMVGLEMNWKSIKEIGKPAVLAGLGQIIFTAAAGFFILLAMGFAFVPSIYISVALTFSSTIIIIQLLSQKRDLGSLYGKIVVGFLLVQDLIAIFGLIFLAGLDETSESATLTYTLGTFTLSLIKGGVLVCAALLLSKYVFPKVLHILGKSQELLFIFGNAWGLGLAALMAAPFIGFSIEIGGFIAGLTVANSMEHFQIGSRMRPIRDFFIMIFFVLLGSELILGNVYEIIIPTILLSIFVLLGNPLIVMIVMAALGYRSRTSFLASLTVAQISEFSLIMAAMGGKLGHLSESEVSLVTFVGVITITISSYLIMHGGSIYEFLRSWLKVFEFRQGVAEKVLSGDVPYANHTVLVGAHRMGGNILAALKSTGEEFVVVDFDPQIIGKLKNRGIPVIYGDISEDEIKELSALARARALISTVPDLRDNMQMIDYLKKENPKAAIVVTAENEWEAGVLYELGASYVILPHFIGGLQIAQAIKKDHHFDYLAKLKDHDLSLIRGNSWN